MTEPDETVEPLVVYGSAEALAEIVAVAVATETHEGGGAAMSESDARGVDEDAWVDVFLGDVRIGDTVRVKTGTVSEDSRYVNATGTIVGVRSGAITVQIGNDNVLFFPRQLERRTRPE